MIIETPQPTVYSAATLMGTLNKKGGPQGMAVVMKAAYRLVSDGASPRQMDAIADTAQSAIVMADHSTARFTASKISPPIIKRIINPEDYVIQGENPEVQVLAVDGHEFTLKKINNDPDMTIDIDVTYEADTALSKSRADIIVLGFISASGEGAVVVDGSPWMTRTPPLPDSPDADMTRNLFGFEPRQGTSRQDEADDFSAFASMHRRGPGVFVDPGTGAGLPSRKLVEIYQRSDTTGDPDYALRLPDLEQGIRLRVYCGHGPDEAPYWRKVNRGLMQPDTLIVDPGAHWAVILWRCHWPADLEPMDRYRKVQIHAGGF
uniref:hypothetical protein n=1 Tax=uncultured Halomonas sp. TaxID=173971 RepID=UPI0026040805|nr:hypothetical protein [uncultured Halomonas sp.]